MRVCVCVCSVCMLIIVDPITPYLLKILMHIFRLDCFGALRFSQLLNSLMNLAVQLVWANNSAPLSTFWST